MEEAAYGRFFFFLWIQLGYLLIHFHNLKRV